jgi:HEXXH motif-containing protein
MAAIQVDQDVVSAVAVHGGGPDRIRSFERLVAGHGILSLAEALPALAEASCGPAIAQLDPIVAGLARLHPDQAVSIFRDPLWRAWLAATTGAPDPDSVEHLLLRAPVLVAAWLNDWGPESRWVAALPATRCLSPIGGRAYLAARAGSDGRVDLVREGAGWQAIQHEGLPPVAVWPDQDSQGPHYDQTVEVSERTRVAYGIDMLDDQAFPELAANRRSHESAYTGSAQLVEAHLADVFDLLRRAWPEAVHDVQAFFRGLLPISVPGHWNSATAGELPLCLQLTFWPDSMPLDLGESVVHETAHAKLDLLLAMTPLLENGPERLYRHPWRSDRRPLSGVLMGAHAFLNVVHYYHRCIQAGVGGGPARQELDRRLPEVVEALELLSREGRFTAEGRSLLQSMIDSLRPLLRSRVAATLG